MSRQKTFTMLILGLALVFGVLIGLLAIFGEGESELALTEYFQQIDPIVSGIDDRTGAQVVDEPAQAFIIWQLALGFTARDLDAIDPPKEVAAVHQELVDAIHEEEAAVANLADQHPEVQSLDEVERLRDGDEDLLLAYGHTGEACAKLREIARANGIEVELELC